MSHQRPAKNPKGKPKRFGQQPVHNYEFSSQDSDLEEQVNPPKAKPHHMSINALTQQMARMETKTSAFERPPHYKPLNQPTFTVDAHKWYKDDAHSGNQPSIRKPMSDMEDLPGPLLEKLCRKLEKERDQNIFRVLPTLPRCC